ncbi:hypothetical protein M404DRAFT_999900 [Pisolithus tinctorius Marx 270]|uniref:Uncharacterized protein n=1 Tax=Pisolithus tinctorius Marx 270 TaxID=870435 RepID=A0A0C3J8D1_PISTI|nr:hypothetical protein M404DRAFT_999900 [Pisolithus tinctorius Marx 270]
MAGSSSKISKVTRAKREAIPSALLKRARRTLKAFFMRVVNKLGTLRSVRSTRTK